MNKSLTKINTSIHRDQRERMSIYYCGTDGNKLLVVQVDDNNASNVLQEISPVAPNPLQLPEGVYNGIATEWVVRHPTLPLLFALTSYWNAMESRVTTFRIQTSENNGRLTQVGDSVSTRGLHAAHACISPDGSLLVIAHHNDGKLVFLNIRSPDEKHHPIIQEEPCCIIDTPEVIWNTRRIPRRKDACPGLPSLHHIQYAPNNNNSNNNNTHPRYLLTVDPSQDYIFTYRVDARGLPTSGIPVSSFACSSPAPIYGWFQRFITNYVLQCQQRTRKAVVHPNGKYVYVLYESINRLQVYSINNDGVVDQNKDGCWQDVSTLADDDPCNRSPSWCPTGMVGMTLQCASEVSVSPDGSTLWVANRGDVKVAGISRGESSICVFSIEDHGRRLVHQGVLPGVTGPVRHFLVVPEMTASEDNRNVKIVAGICQPTKPKHPSCLQTFVPKPNNNPSKKHDDKGQSSEHKKHELYSVANIGANVFCIAH